MNLHIRHLQNKSSRLQRDLSLDNFLCSDLQNVSLWHYEVQQLSALRTLPFGRTHQHSRSQYASKVPDLLRDVFTLHGGTTREEEQDVAQHTHNGQRYEGDPQTLGKAARTHSDTGASTAWLRTTCWIGLLGSKTLVEQILQDTLDLNLVLVHSSCCGIKLRDTEIKQQPSCYLPVCLPAAYQHPPLYGYSF